MTTSTLLPVAKPAQVRRAALNELRADKRSLALIVTLTALAAVAGLVGPRLLGDMVNAVQTRSGHSVVASVDRLALLTVVFTLVQIVLVRWAQYAATGYGERAAARIRERFLDRLLALPAAAVEHIPAGDLIARGTSDVTSVAASLRSLVPEVLVAAAQVVAIVVGVLVLNPTLGACSLGCLVVVSLVLRWYLRRTRPAYLSQGAATSAVADVLVTTAAGARTVDALSLQHRRKQAADAAIAESRRAGLATLRLRSVLYPTVDVSYIVPLASVLLIGAAMYHSGSVSLGTVIAATAYMRQLVAPMDVILLWIEPLQRSAASYARVEGLASITPSSSATATGPEHAGLAEHVERAERPGPTGRPEPPLSSDRIEVVDAHFAYPHGADVLHGVDLTIRPGERLALVGPSGAGKSTLGRLLAGIDRPHVGRVTVGGIPVADLPPELLRRQIVLVTQEQHVFRDTLRDNLLLADPAADDARVTAALEAVGASWLATLPDGLDTRLGDDAHRIDGAQAQQISLARVVLADPHTVVLDEATALLDPATARTTESALAAVLSGRTVIAIAHRLHTAHDADRIAVMAAGRITELGAHDDLVAANGTYAALWRAWHG